MSEIAYSSLAIVVSKSSPVKNLQELLATAREKPESLSYGRSGNGTSAHLAGELLNTKGGAPALTAVIAGEIPTSVNPLPGVVGPIEANAVRALAVTIAPRSKALPDVPTIAEAGIPGYAAPEKMGATPVGSSPRGFRCLHAH